MSENPISHTPIFYACIPETPDGPPFEIAWAAPALETPGVTCESRLIRPPPSWAPALIDDPSALSFYGLNFSDLQRFGVSTRALAVDMNEALAGRELFSATTADDAHIRRIFDAAKTPPQFALRKTDADALIAELAQLRRTPPKTLARAKREAEVMCLTGVRAEAKARYLATYWRFVAGVN